jgi:hypothetical protein
VPLDAECKNIYFSFNPARKLKLSGWRAAHVISSCEFTQAEQTQTALKGHYIITLSSSASYLCTAHATQFFTRSEERRARRGEEEKRQHAQEYNNKKNTHR